MQRIFFISFVTVFLFVSGCSQQNLSVVAPAKQISDAVDPSGILEHGSRKAKVVALTFDADMTPKMKNDLKIGVVKSWYEKGVIDILEKNNVPATLFLTGMWAESYPDVTKELGANPLFEIGNHSHDHGGFHMPCYGLAEVKDKRDEVTKTQEILKNLIGYTPRYFRFPGGCGASDDVALVSQLGLQVTGWDAISGDAYIRDSAGPIISQTLKNAQNGSIIVFHMHGGRTAPQTVYALQAVIDGLRDKGFSFVKVSEL